MVPPPPPPHSAKRSITISVSRIRQIKNIATQISSTHLNLFVVVVSIAPFDIASLITLKGGKIKDQSSQSSLTKTKDTASGSCSISRSLPIPSSSSSSLSFAFLFLLGARFTCLKRSKIRDQTTTLSSHLLLLDSNLLLSL